MFGIHPFEFARRLKVLQDRRSCLHVHLNEYHQLRIAGLIQHLTPATPLFKAEDNSVHYLRIYYPGNPVAAIESGFPYVEIGNGTFRGLRADEFAPAELTPEEHNAGNVVWVVWTPMGCVRANYNEVAQIQAERRGDAVDTSPFIWPLDTLRGIEIDSDCTGRKTPSALTEKEGK
jgi:hypothetical protein